MAIIAIVEAYPYATICGGDAVYLERLRDHLRSQGHSLASFVTDVSRGRTSPLLRLHHTPGTGQRWRVRRALPLGGGRYLALAPTLLLNAVRRMGGLHPIDDGPGEDEARWLVRQLRRLAPDVTILAFGACAFSDALTRSGFEVAALRGFLVETENRLGDGEQTTRPLPPRHDAELAPARFVAFNNKGDAEAYSARTGREAAVVGMSFPRRAGPAIDAGPTLLFVGAATACNQASLTWFLDQCWPTIIARVPDAQLRVVGKVAGMFGSGLPSGVRAIGPVADLANEYVSARLVIVPLVSGSNGVKTKVVEALSFGRPIVTTSLGTEPAYREQLGGGMTVADEPDAFAAAVITLLRDKAAGNRAAAAATALFDRLYSDQAAYGSIDRFVARMVHAARPELGSHMEAAPVSPVVAWLDGGIAPTKDVMG